jgi:hypothetical protein
MIVNDKLERVWKEVVRVCFKILFQHLHGKIIKHLSQSSLLLYLILGPPEYKMEVLSIIPWYLVILSNPVTFLKNLISLGLNLLSHFLSLCKFHYTLSLNYWRGSGRSYKIYSELLHTLVCCYITLHFPQDEEVEEHTSYYIVRAGYESAVLSHLCDTVRRILEHVDWVLSRLRAEYTAMTRTVSDRLQASKCYHLKQQYRNIY